MTPFHDCAKRHIVLYSIVACAAYSAFKSPLLHYVALHYDDFSFCFMAPYRCLVYTNMN